MSQAVSSGKYAVSISLRRVHKSHLCLQTRAGNYSMDVHLLHNQSEALIISG